MNQSIEQYIAQGKIDEAVAAVGELLEALSSKYKQDWSLISSRLHTLQDQMNRGVISDEAYGLEKNRINLALFQFVSEVREEILQRIEFYRAFSPGEEGFQDHLQFRLLGKYEVIRQIKEGNTSIIFQARDANSKRDVAIKLIKNQGQNLDGVNEEIQRIAGFKHRNIIKILDVSLEKPPRYVVTEYVRGLDLKRILDRLGALPFYRVQEIATELADALDYIRQRRVVHTNIRPSKVMIDEEGKPVISPFEIIKASSESVNLGKFMDDCQYLSPEVLQGEINFEDGHALDKSDQFSVAVLIFELLTGRPLFEGANVSQLIESRLHFFRSANFRNHRLRAVERHQGLAKVLNRMLSESPKARYNDLRSALKALSGISSNLSAEGEKAVESYHRCLAGGDLFIKTFYDNFFSNFPPMKAQFGDIDRQYVMLQNAIYSLFDTDWGADNLQRILGIDRHKGVSNLDFCTFLQHIADTARQCDRKWNDEIETAWKTTIQKCTTTINALVTTTQNEQ